MSLQELKKKTEGFTIIEVLIVLAIAALIMLIVFLAIPQLRRNQQNSAMRNEASRLLSAVTEYESNANGVQVDAQDKFDSVYDGTFPPTNKATQLTGAHTYDTAKQATPETTSLLVIGTCVGNVATPDASGVRTYAMQFGLRGGQTACIQS